LLHFAAVRILRNNEGMPLLQIRDLPEHLYRKLADEAAKEHRSLSQQAIAVLAKGLDVEADPKARRKRVLEEIKRLHLGHGKSLLDPVKLIRQDRDR
jgi:plasmid stability protein